MSYIKLSHMISSCEKYFICLGSNNDNIGCQFTITYSNILSNKASNGDGMIKSRGNAEISHCCILENECDLLFNTGSNAYIYITNCTIDEKDITKTKGSVTTNDWKPI